MPDQSPHAESEPPSTQSKYNMVRAQIEHENGLIAHRMTWYLTFQGFLLAATYVVIGQLLENQDKFHTLSYVEQTCLVLVLACLPIFGLLSTMVCYSLILGAKLQIDYVCEWWASQPGSPYYPRINGHKGMRIFRFETHLGATHFTIIIGIIWIVIGTAFWVVFK